MLTSGAISFGLALTPALALLGALTLATKAKEVLVGAIYCSVLEGITPVALPDAAIAA